MHPQQRGRSRGRGGPPGGERGGGAGFRGRGDGDRAGRGGHRGDRGGDRGNRSHSRGRGGPRGQTGFAPRHAEPDVPEYQPDPTEATGVDAPEIAAGVETMGVPRPRAPGTAGRPLTVTTNNFKATLPEVTFHHYDDIQTDEPKPIKWNYQLISELQARIAPAIFTPRALYDGRKNLFASRRLPLAGGGGDAQTFDVSLGPAPPGGRPPRTYKVALKHVATIQPILLQRYQAGQQSISNEVLTAFMAVNLVVRMDPISRYPFKGSSFYTNKEVRPIGGGIELWRGYRQSVRPGLASPLMNIDISTGTMYSPGPMIGVCQQILTSNSPNALVPGQGLSDRDRLKLQRFLSGVRFVTTHRERNGQVSKKPKVLKKITSQSANNFMFTNSDGAEMSVAQYFQTLGTNLSYPNYICIEVDWVRGRLPDRGVLDYPGANLEKTIASAFDGFCANIFDQGWDSITAIGWYYLAKHSSQKPKDRLNSIVAGHAVLQYGQSEYMRDFRMSVDQHPEKCLARVLPAPALNYGPNSKSRQIRPKDGAWNVRDQKFFNGAVCRGWALVIYDTRGIRPNDIQDIIRGLKEQADLLGIQQISNDPVISSPSAQYLDVAQQLRSAGQQVFQKTKVAPSLIVVVLPENSAELYQAVKHFGDVTQGVATQCLKSNKCRGAKPQYWANVCLKINAKLGGVNNVLDPNAPNLRFLTDAANPPIVLGADVMHPAPGAKDRPSFASLVASIDSNVARYTAVSQPQAFRVEMIQNLEAMVYEVLGRHAYWKSSQEKKQVIFPKRLIYYRDGVSEGQFRQVLDVELSAIRAACKRHKIKPSITVVVVGKRHHERFFPTHGGEDRSGNCPAGLVVEDVVGHPTEFDFYLQSHSGIQGTSCSSHYNVLHDENNFTPDGIQAVSYALCHIYARATRSVSIPAPVYYADIVCARAKNHYDPSIGYQSIDDSETTASGATGAGVQRLQDSYKMAHQDQRYKMYYM